MLLADILEKCKDLTFLKPNQYSFGVCYNYWREQLFERCMRLFVYKNLPDTLPRKEIEQRFIMQGFNVITDVYKKELRTFYGTLTNFTGIYFDVPLAVSVASPIFSTTINKDKFVLVDNSSARNALYPLIHHYAVLLGHATVTLQNILVNARDINGVPVAVTQQQKESISKYFSSLWNGKKSSILDKSFLGVEFAGANTGQGMNIKDCMETINNLIDNFYNDIGVKTAKDKKGNMLTPEIEADNPMLLLNINDMLDCRRKGFEEVNKKYGTNIKVDIAEELKSRCDVAATLQGGVEK